MRHTIKKLNIAQPNEKLIVIHMVNFIAVTLALFVQWYLDYYRASLANQLEQMSDGPKKRIND